MKIVFYEWLYNRELLTINDSYDYNFRLPTRDERVSLKGRFYRVVLITHSWDSAHQYHASVELEAITPINPPEKPPDHDHPPPLDWGKETK